MRIVFICEANSTRSQLAEGLAKKLWQRHQPIIESCGSFDGGRINPLVKRILIDNNIDCSAQYSKHYIRLENPQTVDWVITLCGRDYIGNYFANAHKIHKPLGIPGIAFGHGNSGIYGAYQGLAQTVEELLMEIEKVIFKD